MSWKKVKLGDIIQIKKGSYITKKESKEGPYPVILGGQEPAYYIDTFNHTGKAIVISRSGASAGYVSFWNEPIFVTDGFLIEPKDGISIDFLFFLLKSRQAELQGKQGGAAIPHINPRTINAIEVMLPSTQIQERVTLILSTYEDLIKNNQKQIKLLEEAAQRLYKEWFVDFRFPGHETTHITNGIPEGWRIAKLSEVAGVNKQSIPKHYSYDFVDYTDLSSVSKGHIEATTRFTIQDAPGRAKRIASDGDIIWGMVRPNLKSYALVFHPSETNVYSTGFAVLSAKKIPFSFLYCHVIQDDFVGYLVNCTNGAAYPAVKPVHFEEATMLVPTNDLLNQFNLITEPMYRKIETLEKQIHHAKEARDRLLPKLMKREIEV